MRNEYKIRSIWNQNKMGTYFTNDDIDVATEDDEEINDVPKISKVVLQRWNKLCISLVSGRHWTSSEEAINLARFSRR